MIDIDSTFLPNANMRQITRITEVSGAVIVGEVDLGEDHWVFPQHFPDDPIFPGSLIIEAAGQLLALWAWADGQRGRPRLVRTAAEFRHPVTPATQRLVLRGEVKRKRHINFGTISVLAGETEVAVVTGVLTVLPPSDE